MGTGLIIWLIILALLNIGIYVHYKKASKSTCTGGLADALFTIVAGTIIVIADIVTLLVNIF